MADLFLLKGTNPFVGTVSGAGTTALGPLAGGKLYFYDAGTTDDRTVFKDADELVPHAQPVALDADGALQDSVYVPTGDFKVVVKTSAGVELHSEDDLPGALDTSPFIATTALPKFPVISKAADYNIAAGDRAKIINANPSGGSFTLSLPSAVDVGDNWVVGVRHVGTVNSVNIATTGGQTVDGQSSLSLSVYLEAVLLVSDGANWHVMATASPPVVARSFVAAGLGFSIIGGNIIASVSGNALTFAIKTAAGNDPSTYAPVKLVFRGQSAADEEFSVVTLTAATSITVPDTATLGATSGSAFRLWVVGFNDGGTFRLGVINCLSGTNIYPLGQFPVASSLAVGTGSDSAHAFYTDSGVTSKPYQILGYATWESGLGTAGTWSSAPTRFQLFGPGVPLPGAVVQSVNDTTTTSGTTTSSSYAVLTSTPSKAIGLSSAANLVKATAVGTLNNNSSATVFLQLSRGSTLIGNPAGAVPISSNARVYPVTLMAMDFPNTVSPTTYQFQGKTDTGTLNYPAANTGSLLVLDEIMT